MLPLFRIVNTFISTSYILSNSKTRLIGISSLRLLQKNLDGFSLSDDRENYFKVKDRIPDEYNLIYRAPLEKYIGWAVHISSITVAIVSTSCILCYVNGSPVSEIFISKKLVSNVNDFYYFTAGFFAMNTLIRFVASKLPLRIYKNADKQYIAVYVGQIPGIRSQQQFCKSDITKINTLFFNPWKNETYNFKGRSSVIFEYYFKTLSEFNDLTISE